MSRAIAIESRYVDVAGMRTHYLEAGAGPAVVLLHSGEFGGCAEIGWEFTIEPLARHFHVYAPDWLGYGRSAKWFDFEDMRGARVRHIARFLETLAIPHAHFIGSSMGGSLLLEVAAADQPDWPIDRIVVANGGGDVPDTAARHLLNDFDGTIEAMQAIVDALFVRPDLRGNAEYARRRLDFAMMKGAWECTAAVRFKAPNRGAGAPRGLPDYSRIRVPVLLAIGTKDPLRAPGFGRTLQAAIPGASLLEIGQAGHFPHIDQPERFNRAAIDFLARPACVADRTSRPVPA